MTQKVLITGGGGFVGSHVADMCDDRGYDITILDDFSSGKRENMGISGEIIEGSIVDDEVIDFLIKHREYDTIFHLAAQPSLRSSIEDPVNDAIINIIGTINIIKIAKAFNSHLILASTSAVYDPNGELPYRESDCVNPHLPYGIAKATAERYIQDSGVSYTLLRFGNVYGERQLEVGENQLIPHCLNYLLHDKPFVINGDGLQTRDFVYVEDIARANLMAMEKRPQGIFNCGSGEATKVIDLCYMLADINNRREVISGFDFTYGPAKEGEVKHSLLDSQKAYDVFGWKAETDLEDGLRKTYEWAKAQ